LDLILRNLSAGRSVLRVPASACKRACVATLAAGQTATEIRRLSQVANTAPDVLQRMAVGAKTVGIEQEKLSDILKDVNDRVGDFVTTGGGPMADFFEKIAPKVGITADAFRGLSGADALQLFVSSLEKANVSQAEMVFYMEAMASDSTLLLPLLRDNASEMNRLADSSASLGAIMSNETVASLDKMNMAVGEVSLAFQGMRNRIAGRLAPALEMLAVAFTNSMREGAVLRTVLDTIIANLDRVSVYVAVLITGFGVRYVAALVAARIATLSLSAALGTLRTAMIRTGVGAAVVAVGELILFFGRAREAAGGFGNAFKMVALQVKALSMKAFFIEALGSMVSTFIEFTYTVAEGLNDLFGTNLSGMDATITQVMNRAAISARDAADVASAAADALRITLDETEVSAVDVSDSLSRIAGAGVSGAKVAAKALTGAAAEAKERFSNLRASMESSMESGFMSIIEGTASAKDAFRSFAAEAIKELFRVLVIQRLVAGISNAVAPINFFAGIPGKPLANGTSYAQGGMTLVGERGPELVNMPRGSQVIDARRTASRMGNGDIVQNFSFNLSANGDESVRRIVSQAAPQIVEAAKAGVADAVRRGGSYGRAFA
jgi:trimeric autotransporter adhesin